MNNRNKLLAKHFMVAHIPSKRDSQELHKDDPEAIDNMVNDLENQISKRNAKASRDVVRRCGHCLHQ